MAANYTLTCGSQLTLGPLILNESQVDKADASGPQGPTYINTVDGDCSGTRCLVRDVIGTAFINYSGTTIPLFRFQGADVPDPERSSRRLDDLEGFFGAAYTKQQIAQGAKAAAGYDRLHPIANGVFEHLASKQTECQDRIDFLKSIQQACSAPLPSVNAINNTPPPGWSAAITNGRCALDQAIPNTAYSYVSLYNSKPSNFSCDSTKIDRSGSWYQAFAKVETTMPLGFKPAYIVEYFDDVKFDPQTDADLNFYANWFSPIDPNLNPPVPPDGTPYGAGNESQYGLSKLHQRIRVVKVYVPTGFSVSKPLENPSPETARIPTTNYDSGLMHVMKSLMDSDTQKTVEKQAEQDIKTLWSRIKQGTGMMNPAPFSDEFIKCFECVDIDSGGSTIESILVKRINAQGVSPAIGDLEDPTCQADDLLGEKADQRKQQINPIPNPDPVNEIGIRAKATLRAKAEKMPLYENVKIRTYLLLPEEYRNITNYETNFLNVFVPAPSPLQSPPTQFNFAWREKDNSSGKRPWKYLQLNDTKPKNGAANSVFVSSPQVQGNLIGYNVTYDASGNQNQTPVYLQGEIVGPDLQKFDINPQVPGGKLARALWELVCNLTRGPIPGKKTVPYKGFETILTQGPSACVTAATPSPSQPPEGVIDQYLLQEVAKCDGKSGGITAGGGIPLVYSSYQCSSSDPTDLASRFSAPPADVPDLTIPEWKNGTDGTAAICNEDFYSFVACTYSPARKAPYPALIAHKVDSSGKFDPNGTMTACQYVVQQAKAEGVSPRFALSMWGEESGFSSYASKTDGNDFGVVSIPPSRQSGTIASQLSAFLNTCNSHSTYQSFMRDYSGEITPDQNDFCNNKYFPYRIKDFYNYIPQR
ncbi:MAG TPA: hypothetical protein VLH19_01095 [Patescibacteria group bacterium]|nr:hypothetical protein [Patescibacteria group bacterium]